MRQGVHIAPQQRGRARLLAVENGDHRARRPTGGDTEVESVEGVEHRLLGTREVETQLWVGMEASPEGHCRLEEPRCLLDERVASRSPPLVLIGHDSRA